MLIIAIVGGVVGILSLVVSVMASLRASGREKVQDSRVLENRVTAVEIKVGFILDALGKQSALGVLHSPDPEHARTDFLIERYAQDRLASNEIAELVDTLQAIKADGERPMLDREAAKTVLVAICDKYDLLDLSLADEGGADERDIFKAFE